TLLLGEKAMAVRAYNTGGWLFDEPIFTGGSAGTDRSGTLVVTDAVADATHSFPWNWGGPHPGGAACALAAGPGCPLARGRGGHGATARGRGGGHARAVGDRPDRRGRHLHVAGAAVRPGGGAGPLPGDGPAVRPAGPAAEVRQSGRDAAAGRGAGGRPVPV